MEDFLLYYTSPNAHTKRDILETLLLSVLAGHKRYAHVTSIRSDSINPSLLGMLKIVSEDSLRRVLLAVDEAERIAWVQKYLQIEYLKASLKKENHQWDGFLASNCIL